MYGSLTEPCWAVSCGLLCRCSLLLCFRGKNVYILLCINLLKQMLDKQNLTCVKMRSNTRWSADASAVTSLSAGYKEIQIVLEQMVNSQTEKPETQCEARGLARIMKLLETGIMTELWQSLLQRFNKTTISLQSPAMESKTGMSLLISLQDFVKSLREEFQKFEEAGKVRSGNDHYKCEAKRKIKRNKRWDSGDPVRISRLECSS